MTIPRRNYEESQKLFSTGNDELDNLLTEVYYSGIEDGYDYAQKEFASKVWDVDDEDEDEDEKEKRKERAEKRKGRELKNSHRGLGRSLIIGGTLPGAIGAYTTKSDTEADYKKGYSEEDIIRRAGERGAKRGAIVGGALGLAGSAASAHILGPKALAMAPLSAAGGAALGALGSHLGAKKNAKVRLHKSRKSDED